MIRMQCPKCHKKLGIVKLDANGVVGCPWCLHKFRLVRKPPVVVEEDAVEVVEDEVGEIVEEDAVEVVEDEAAELVEEDAVDVMEEEDIVVLEPEEEALELEAEVVEEEAKPAKPTAKPKKRKKR